MVPGVKEQHPPPLLVQEVGQYPRRPNSQVGDLREGGGFIAKHADGDLQQSERLLPGGQAGLQASRMQPYRMPQLVEPGHIGAAVRGQSASQCQHPGDLVDGEPVPAAEQGYGPAPRLRQPPSLVPRLPGGRAQLAPEKDSVVPAGARRDRRARDHLLVNRSKLRKSSRRLRDKALARA